MISGVSLIFVIAYLGQVFTFSHPKPSEAESNDRYKKLQFLIPNDTGSAMVHGMWCASAPFFFLSNACALIEGYIKY